MAAAEHAQQAPAAPNAAAAAPKPAPAAPAADAATVYFGGDILPLTSRAPTTVESLVVRGGKIVYAGGRTLALQVAGPGAIMRDLGGKTLMPGLQESHGHMIASAHSLLNPDMREAKVGLQAIVASTRARSAQPRVCAGLACSSAAAVERFRPVAAAQRSAAALLERASA